MTQNLTASDDSATEIAIRLRHIGQLFSTLDPSPFREKDIDSDVEEFIVDWVRELPPQRPFHIVVNLPADEACKPEAGAIGDALAHYFLYRADVAERELRELFRTGRTALLIGAAVLSVCLIASQLVPRVIPNRTMASIIEESLILVGWVANWRPIEIYLYDWWPIRRRVQLFRRIAAAPVLVRPV